MKLLLTIAVIALALIILRRSNEWKSQHKDMVYMPPPGEGDDADVERLMRAGRKMSAIKVYRETHGVGLKEAKEAVEKMARGKHIR